jgi:hypothetical protein
MDEKREPMCKGCRNANACPGEYTCPGIKALRKVREVMAFSSRDWSKDPEFRAIYGAVHGDAPRFQMLARGKAKRSEPVMTGAFITTCDSHEPADTAQQSTSTSPGPGVPGTKPRGHEPLAVTRVSTSDVPIAASKTRACVGHGESRSGMIPIERPGSEKAGLRPLRALRRKGR